MIPYTRRLSDTQCSSGAPGLALFQTWETTTLNKFPNKSWNKSPLFQFSSCAPRTLRTHHERRHRPPRFSEVHGLGRHRPGLDLRRRHSRLARLRPAASRRSKQSTSPLSRSATATSASTSPPTPTSPRRCKLALDKINAGPTVPDFIIHTGDLTHLPKPAEFDTLDQVLTATKRQVFYVPGEHDTSVDDGKLYLDALRQGHRRQRLVQLRSQRRALHRPGQRGAARRHGQAGRSCNSTGSSRISTGLKTQHADRRLRAHPALGGLSRVGLGHRRQRAGAGHAEALRLGHRAQRPHSPDHAEGRRQRHLPHRDVDRLSATRARHRAQSRAR